MHKLNKSYISLSYPLGLTLLLCLSLSSKTVKAAPKPIPSQLNILTQPRNQTNTPDTNRAAAEKAEAEAKKLDLKTVPITQGIAKWEEALKYWRLASDRNKEAATLDQIAKLYWVRGEYRKALEYAKKALPICQALGDRECQGAVATSLSLIYDQLGEYQKAIAFYEQVPLFFTETPNLRPTTLNNIAHVYDKLGEKQKAIDAYEQAFDFWKKQGDAVNQAKTLEKIAFLYYASLGEINKSLEILKQANSLDPEFKRDRTLSNLIYFSVANSICTDKLDTLKKPPEVEQPKTASNPSANSNGEAVVKNNIESWNKNVEKWQKLEILGAEADFLEIIGDFGYTQLGEYSKAWEVYQKALNLRQIMGGKSAEAKTLINGAEILNKQGKKQEAIDYLNQALDIQRQIKTRPAQADTLLTLGDVYSSLGAYPESLKAYEQALSLWRESSDRTKEADTLINIGNVHRKLQNYPQALNYYQQALSISRPTGDCRNEALILERISSTYLNSGNYQQAINFGHQAIALSHNLEVVEYKLAIEAGTSDILAQVKLKQKNYSQALKDSQKTIKLAKKSGYKEIEARTYTSTAEAYNALKQPEKAIQTYQEQLTLYTQMGLVAEQAQSLHNIAKLQRQNKQISAALTEIDKAIKIIENIRQEVDSEDLRTSFFATVQDYYQLKINILMELHQQDPSKGYDGQALQTSESSRARVLVELLTQANINIRKNISPELADEERRLQWLREAREKRLSELASQSQPSAELIASIKQEIEDIIKQQQELAVKIRSNSPEYAALNYPQPLTLSQIQQQLDSNTVMLQYSLGKEHSYLWAITPNSLDSYELPPQAQIEKAANDFRQSLIRVAASNKQQATAARQLSQIILAPVANKLAKRLVIVADGTLQNIPFAALTEPTAQESYQPLLINHEIVNLPSASTIAILRQETQQRKKAPKAIAILADPVFSADDSRVTGKPENNSITPDLDLQRSALSRSARNLNRNGWDRLTGTREEAQAILKLGSAKDSLAAFDFDANYNWVKNPQLSQYRVIHLATHGFADDANPELSGIVLSLVDKQGKPERGYLRLNDIFNLNFPADLIVLSACETGQGKEIQGEGLVGLTRGLMYAGSPRIVVSLWNVDDEGTKELMTQFYRQMWQEGKSPVAALRAAQLSLWQNPNWRKPLYWAAFTLQGEWR
ncbi:TPR repeat-containing protein [Anabaenopsis circularis NIES-21]|uniref:TPR repeat-containing protein n=1 Tax=Anabaenopsis circularis NIES-21 TaxID=1085406 RepID=A0A1Z4GHE7_9CYAN|nr:TPR repeat-containing protein [Anabaenopsis circularis NIES-21]